MKFKNIALGLIAALTVGAAAGWFSLGAAIRDGHIKSDGQGIVPDGWLAEATTTRTDIGRAERGYGYQWWTYADGTFAARGIFGQGIFIDPTQITPVLVIYKTSF